MTFEAGNHVDLYLMAVALSRSQSGSSKSNPSATYRTVLYGPNPSKVKKPKSNKGMTIEGPPKANESNDITQTDGELWMEDAMTQSEIDGRREKIDSLLRSNPTPKSHEAVSKKFEVNAGKHWDEFYKRNGDRFFKDRHYLEASYPALSTPNFVFIECGCGVGNALLPLLESNSSITVIGGDFSKTAVETVKRDERFIAAQTENVEGGRTGRAFSEVWDITESPYPGTYKPKVGGEEVPFGAGFADAAMLLFCLSAIPPAKFDKSVSHVRHCIKDGGLLFFRDYGRLDDSQMHLLPSCLKDTGRVLSPDTYVKQDGTICHYFDKDEVRNVFERNGFEVVELEWVRRQYMNRGEGKARRRTWLHGVFKKKMEGVVEGEEVGRAEGEAVEGNGATKEKKKEKEEGKKAAGSRKSCNVS